jgi:amino acid transporter
LLTHSCIHCTIVCCTGNRWFQKSISLRLLRILGALVNIGALLAFTIVCTAVLIMRRSNPDAPRPFRCPLVPLIPLLGIALCLLVMSSLPVDSWLQLIVWLFIGFAVYFAYGRHPSVLARAGQNSAGHSRELVKNASGKILRFDRRPLGLFARAA